MSDLISRQAVLEIQAKYAEHIGATKFWQMRDDIRALPSVETERKVGKWVHMVGFWECDQCHAEYTGMPTCMGKVIYEYCPNCGARMEVDG